MPRQTSLVATLAALVVGSTVALTPGGPAVGAAPGAEPQRFVVEFADGTAPDQQRAALTAAGVRSEQVLHAIEQIEYFVVEVPAPIAGVVAAAPGVEAVWPDAVVELLYTPDDPAVPSLQNLDDIGVEGAWDTYPGPGGFDPDGPFTGAPIAIIDTGVDDRHVEFGGADGSVFAAKVPICTHYPPNVFFDPVDCGNGADDTISHGTHVAGIAAAIADDGTGIAGISPTSPIYSYKACQGRLCWVGDVAAALVDATDDGAKVINMSLGGVVALGPWQDAVRYALEHDVVVVGASGNLGNSMYAYPASFNGVLSVSATETGTDSRADFSQYNDEVDLAAPGTGIHAPIAPEAAAGADDAYAAYGGTSMAAPHVAGAAALLRSAHPDWTAGQTRGALLATARDIGVAGIDPEFGSGMLDVDAAIDHDWIPDGDMDDDTIPDRLDGDPYDPSRWDVTPVDVNFGVADLNVSVASFWGAGVVAISAPGRMMWGMVSLRDGATSLSQVTLVGFGWQMGPGILQLVPFAVVIDTATGTARVQIGGVTEPVSVSGPAVGSLDLTIY